MTSKEPAKGTPKWFELDDRRNKAAIRARLQRDGAKPVGEKPEGGGGTLRLRAALRQRVCEAPPVMTPGFDAAELFARLHKAGIRYVVIGGFAVIAHGAQRFTRDLDICPDPDRENLARLARLLRELGARQVGDFAEAELPYDLPSRPRLQRAATSG